VEPESRPASPLTRQIRDKGQEKETLGINGSNQECNSMKFPKPRNLLKNEFPDLTVVQPNIFKKVVSEIVYPEEDTKRDRYIEETVKTLKNRAKQKAKAAKLNEIFINKELYFVPIFIRSSLDKKKMEEIKSLVDTGAANSLIHADIAKKLGLKFEPAQITLKTATGTDKDSIKGITHQKIYLTTTRGKIVTTCINLIISEKLN